MNLIKDYVFIITGIVCASFGIKGFLIPSQFIDGGVTGISMLISGQTGVSLPILIFLINLPFVIMAFNMESRIFALRSLLAIIGLSLVIFFVQFPIITQDKLLSAVFGGFFLGAGIGLCIRGGGVLDGTEILALIVTKRLGISVGDVILVLNIVIFSVGTFFLGAEKALYSMLTYFAASRTVDFIIHGIEEYIGITIISRRSDSIKQKLMTEMGYGLTVYKGSRGLSQVDQDILFCTITRLEIPKIKKIINELDEHAFLVMHHLHDTSGGLIKKKWKK